MLRTLIFSLGLALVVFVVLASSPAHAEYVDFRADPYSDAHGQAQYSTTTPRGIFITITAQGGPGALLYHDQTDGLGIQDVGYENDEIEGSELLEIRFETSLFVEEVYLTDLFSENGYLEEGWYYLDGDEGTKVFFSADPSQDRDSTNGELTLHVGRTFVSITFGAVGAVDGPNGPEYHEFSVAGLTVPMPEPSGALLFAIGSTLVAGALRRRDATC